MPTVIQNFIEAYSAYPMFSHFLELSGIPTPVDFIDFWDRFLNTYPTARQLLVDFPLGSLGLDNRVHESIGSSQFLPEGVQDMLGQRDFTR